VLFHSSWQKWRLRVSFVSEAPSLQEQQAGNCEGEFKENMTVTVLQAAAAIQFAAGPIIPYFPTLFSIRSGGSAEVSHTSDLI
jgi:hypothetical protein